MGEISPFKYNFVSEYLRIQVMKGATEAQDLFFYIEMGNKKLPEVAHCQWTVYPQGVFFNATESLLHGPNLLICPNQ